MMNVQVIDHIATPDAGLQAYVLDMFQTHTGYARADLVPDADFESDLGIDSVTLATTLAELLQGARPVQPAKSATHKHDCARAGAYRAMPGTGRKDACLAAATLRAGARSRCADDGGNRRLQPAHRLQAERARAGCRAGE
ncbi:hypothetical protein KIV45_06905 [Janthinobacterium lividum]|nr:hypothetical protein KIV45_06905 [Janthinobacterium lividum]